VHRNTGNLLAKIKKGLSKRDTGVPSRFLFDKNISKPFLKFLRESLSLDKEDLVPGGKYHNFSDFFSFPNTKNKKLEFAGMPQLKHAGIEKHKDIFDAIKAKDRALFFPYHSYNYVVEFLNSAANDPDVISIKVTQYRVAKDSAVVKAMIDAVKNGKDVMVFVEVKARFDEELNIQWAEEMEKAGVKVFYSFPGLKVHAKLALVTRIENGKEVKYSYFGTGNFNEKTAKIYSDIALFTKDERLTTEAEYVFKFLSGEEVDYDFQHLLVAQFNMRKELLKLIDNEIQFVREGNEAKITLKLNSLEDRKMIKKLYEAGTAGVKINIIIRGICCLIPGVEGLSENINVISILDRYLEHSRVYIFHNGGDEKIYAASADWMKRNLSRRVEVAFPIYDLKIKKEIKDIVALQLKDKIKARVIDKDNLNEYQKTKSRIKISSQTASYNYLKKKNSTSKN
ncbi:MAG: polyphosphate kinase 1, partial [Ignavibacteria bacterium GWB2_35_6b]